MTKTEIKEIVSTCLDQRKLCRVFLRYDVNYRYYFPLIKSDKLFLGAEEEDFLLDGYSIRRFKDVTKALVSEDMYHEILMKEGIVDSLAAPDINMTNLYSDKINDKPG
ncbi:MAG TPA: hypothetical protein VHO66_10550 [Ruminiclostridium sp.]|nr:hypothetical protein [Ruminiclostridium sp.]